MMIEGISHARFCAFKGEFWIAVGKISAKLVTFMPSIMPKKNAIAVTGAITTEGLLNFFQKKLSTITTIAGG